MAIHIKNINGTGGLRLINESGIGGLSIQNIPYVPAPPPTPYVPPAESLVTTNLVLNLDAGDVSSYPGTGTTWTDLSGNNNTGTLSNSVTYSSNNGGYLIFDGTNDVVTCADSTTLSQTNSITILAWINGTVTAAGNSVGLVTKGLSSAADYDYMLYTSTNTTAFVGYKKTSAAVAASTPGYNVNLVGSWNMIGLTIDGTDINQWLNGRAVGGTTAANAGIRDTTNLLNIGFGFQNAFPGYIAQVLIYSSALSTAEMVQNYNATKTRFGL